jgi:hypothetical protein
MPIPLPISLVLAIAVAAGVAVGVFADPSVVDLSPWLIAAASLVAMSLRSSAFVRTTHVACAAAMAGAACLIGATANTRAIHSPLREFLEDRLGGFAIDSVETQRNETPTIIEGIVMEDAQPTESGAVLRVVVDRG